MTEYNIAALRLYREIKDNSYNFLGEGYMLNSMFVNGDIVEFEILPFEHRHNQIVEQHLTTLFEFQHTINSVLYYKKDIPFTEMVEAFLTNLFHTLITDWENKVFYLNFKKSVNKPNFTIQIFDHEREEFCMSNHSLLNQIY